MRSSAPGSALMHRPKSVGQHSVAWVAAPKLVTRTSCHLRAISHTASGNHCSAISAIDDHSLAICPGAGGQRRAQRPSWLQDRRPGGATPLLIFQSTACSEIFALRTQLSASSAAMPPAAAPEWRRRRRWRAHCLGAASVSGCGPLVQARPRCWLHLQS